jgi:hypothetical protein
MKIVANGYEFAIHVRERLSLFLQFCKFLFHRDAGFSEPRHDC